MILRIWLFIFVLLQSTETVLQLTVVIPAAGLGTRFLPITKIVAKEFLPIMNKPVIHYVVEEAIAAHCSDFVFIVNPGNTALRSYFTLDLALEATLEERNKSDVMIELNQLIERITSIKSVVQEKPLGLGHAILQARNEIVGDFFAIMLPDNIVFSEVPAIKQLHILSQKYDATVLGIESVSPADCAAYGLVIIDKEVEPGLYSVLQIIEKPTADIIASIMSPFVTTGRHVVSVKLFDSLATIAPGKANEYQLSDAINDMINRGETVLAYTFEGSRFDTGRPSEWLKTVQFFASNK